MYKKMLVPLDGSPLAEKVLPYAKQIADSLNMGLVFLHVCQHNESEFMCKAYIDHVAELPGTKLKAMGEVIDGDPTKAIISYADGHDFDLVLLATHGQSGFGGWTTGRTVHKVITASKIPIMLVRPDMPEKPITHKWPKNILIPLDGSPMSESVFPYIEMLAQQGHLELEVTLLKVCEPPDLLSDYPEGIMPLTWEEHVKRAKTETQNRCSSYLSESAKHLQASGIQIHSDVILGDKDNVAREIADYVNKKTLDLIAMSTHGRSGISEWPFGHVADKLVRTVSVPLFVVRPNIS